MLSLWANWLQLNSQLNSTGVSFWLYRIHFHADFLGKIHKFVYTKSGKLWPRVKIELILVYFTTTRVHEKHI